MILWGLEDSNGHLLISEDDPSLEVIYEMDERMLHPALAWWNEADAQRFAALAAEQWVAPYKRLTVVNLNERAAEE